MTFDKHCEILIKVKAALIFWAILKREFSVNKVIYFNNMTCLK